ILRPASPDSGLSAKSVDRDTALLFLTLREPGPLPAYARAALGETAARTVARLVADGVLEIGREGAFVAGAAALDLFRETVGREGSGRIAELSLAALRYGQSLAVDDPVLLSWRLYTYHHRPLTPRWKRLLSTPEVVADGLGSLAELARARCRRLGIARGTDVEALREPSPGGPRRRVRGGPRGVDGGAGHSLQGGRRRRRPPAAGQDRGLFPHFRALGRGGRGGDPPARGSAGPGSPLHLGDRRRRSGLLGRRSRGRDPRRRGRELAPLADPSAGAGAPLGSRHGGRRERAVAVRRGAPPPRGSGYRHLDPGRADVAGELISWRSPIPW